MARLGLPWWQLLLLAVVAVGCAKSADGMAPAQPSRAAPASHEDEASEAEGAAPTADGEAELGALEAELAQAAQILARQRPTAEVQEEPAPPSATTAAPPTESASQKATAGAAQQLADQPSCSDCCRAFASMKRACDRICEIVGTEAARCDAAQRRVSDSEVDLRATGCAC